MAADRLSDDDLVARFERRFRVAEAAEAENRERFREDRDFCFDDDSQWSSTVKGARGGRPSLTINRMQPYLRHITNEARQNPPGIEVHPSDAAATKDTSQAIQGLVRGIENVSKADQIYTDAFESAVSGGFGFFRVVTEYEDENSFDLVLRIKRVEDHLSVGLDPERREVDGSDAQWGYLTSTMLRSEFERRWPDAQPFQSSSDPMWGGTNSETVTIAESFERDIIPDVLLLLPEGIHPKGNVFLSSQVPPELRALAVKKRKTTRTVTWWRKYGAGSLLEETEFPCDFVPIIQVKGREYWKDGRQKLFSGIHYAKDAQRMYNYARSAMAEKIATSPKAPWIGFAGQFTDRKWMTANTANHPYLEVQPVTINGNLAPLPHRTDPTPVDPALTQEVMVCSEEIKATLGIFDANIGARSNETSGVAIKARKAEGEAANYDLHSNFHRAVELCGRILVNAIPRVYDTARAVMLLGPDGKSELKTINAHDTDKDGNPYLYDLSVGKYGVVVKSGPSYTTKREQAAEAIMGFVQAMPQTASMVADLIVRAQDWPDADRIADRLKRAIPPQVLGPEDQSDEEKTQSVPAAQVQQMMSQMQGQLAQMATELKARDAELQTRLLEKQMDVQGRIDVATIQADAKFSEAQIRADAAVATSHVDARAGVAQSLIGGMQQPEPGTAPEQRGEGEQNG